MYYLSKTIKRCDVTPSILNYGDLDSKRLIETGFQKNPVKIHILKHIEHRHILHHFSLFGEMCQTHYKIIY